MGESILVYKPKGVSLSQEQFDLLSQDASDAIGLLSDSPLWGDGWMQYKCKGKDSYDGLLSEDGKKPVSIKDVCGEDCNTIFTFVDSYLPKEDGYGPVFVRESDSKNWIALFQVGKFGNMNTTWADQKTTPELKNFTNYLVDGLPHNEVVSIVSLFAEKDNGNWIVVNPLKPKPIMVFGENKWKEKDGIFYSRLPQKKNIPAYHMGATSGSGTGPMSGRNTNTSQRNNEKDDGTGKGSIFFGLYVKEISQTMRHYYSVGLSTLTLIYDVKKDDLTKALIPSLPASRLCIFTLSIEETDPKNRVVQQTFYSVTPEMLQSHQSRLLSLEDRGYKFKVKLCTRHYSAPNNFSELDVQVYDTVLAQETKKKLDYDYRNKLIKALIHESSINSSQNRTEEEWRELCQYDLKSTEELESMANFFGLCNLTRN